MMRTCPTTINDECLSSSRPPKFPVGCPVYFNFQPPDVREGVVKSVSLNTDGKRFEFQIKGRRNIELVEVVGEENLAFAVSCPVLITVGDGDVEGKVLFVKPLHNDDGRVVSMSYIVQYAMEEDLLRMEEGVDPDRISFQCKAQTHHGHRASRKNSQRRQDASPPVIPPVSPSNSSDGGRGRGLKVELGSIGQALGFPASKWAAKSHISRQTTADTSSSARSISSVDTVSTPGGDSIKSIEADSDNMSNIRRDESRQKEAMDGLAETRNGQICYTSTATALLNPARNDPATDALESKELSGNDAVAGAIGQHLRSQDVGTGQHRKGRQSTLCNSTSHHSLGSRKVSSKVKKCTSARSVIPGVDARGRNGFPKQIAPPMCVLDQSDSDCDSGCDFYDISAAYTESEDGSDVEEEEELAVSFSGSDYDEKHTANGLQSMCQLDTAEEVTADTPTPKREDFGQTRAQDKSKRRFCQSGSPSIRAFENCDSDKKQAREKETDGPANTASEQRGIITFWNKLRLKSVPHNPQQKSKSTQATLPKKEIQDELQSRCHLEIEEDAAAKTFKNGDLEDKSERLCKSTGALLISEFKDCDGSKELSGKGETEDTTFKNSRANSAPDQSGTGTFWNKLTSAIIPDNTTENKIDGATYFRRGKRKATRNKILAALPLFNIALVKQREELGHDHVDCGTTLNEIGVCWMMLGELEPALMAFEEALYIREQSLGADAAEVAETTNNIAKLFAQETM